MCAGTPRNAGPARQKRLRKHNKAQKGGKKGRCLYKTAFFVKFGTLAGVAQLVERDLPKVDVEGSIPFSRSKRTLKKGSFFYHCRMHFRKFIPGTLFIALTLCATTALHAEEEKSLWQRFVDWFKPAPSLEGEGPLYDELRELDNQIDRTEGRYSRERRPGNKTRLKKELEDLRTKREKLVEKILAEEEAKKNQPAVAAPATVPASSAAVADTSKPAVNVTEACAHDTVFVRDTVVVHDTLYVIVSGKPGEQQAPAAQPADSTSAATTPADTQAQPTK